MGTTCKMLGQAHLTTTDPFSIFSPDQGKQVIIRNIFLCNTSFTPVKYTIFHDNIGQMYLDSTTLYKMIEVSGNNTDKIDCHICMNEKLGNLAVSCNVANALTVTLYGMEI